MTNSKTTRLTPMERAMMWERMSGERLSDAERKRITDGGEFTPPHLQTTPPGREWFVIESSRKNAVFAPADTKTPRGYIPRDAAEQLLGRDLSGNVWFTREESEAMRGHPEWRSEAP